MWEKTRSQSSPSLRTKEPIEQVFVKRWGLLAEIGEAMIENNILDISNKTEEVTLCNVDLHGQVCSLVADRDIREALKQPLHHYVSRNREFMVIGHQLDRPNYAKKKADLYKSMLFSSNLLSAICRSIEDRNNFTRLWKTRQRAILDMNDAIAKKERIEFYSHAVRVLQLSDYIASILSSNLKNERLE